ncbi:MAG: acyl-CoA dehydrogenase, partial [Desulfurella sp.]
MNFQLTDEEKMVQDTVRSFAQKELKPIASDIDKNHKIPDSIIKGLAELGLFGVYIPQEYGGAGLSFLSYAITVEEISKVCASTGVLISAHTSLCANPIYEFGTK